MPTFGGAEVAGARGNSRPGAARPAAIKEGDGTALSADQKGGHK